MELEDLAEEDEPATLPRRSYTERTGGPGSIRAPNTVSSSSSLQIINPDVAIDEKQGRFLPPARTHPRTHPRPHSRTAAYTRTLLVVSFEPYTSSRA